jgi:hypothetical protein
MTMKYKHFSRARWVLACVALVLAAITIVYFAARPRPINVYTAFVVACWALLPPAWFFGEYYAVDHDAFTELPVAKDAMLESVKAYADYASKIWAAVLASVLFLVAKS